MNSIAGQRNPDAPRALARKLFHQIDPKFCVETRMLTSGLCRIPFLMLVIALTVPTWSSCLAGGSFQTKPAFPNAVRADDPPSTPTITWPKLSESALVGGCGKGRVSDPQTHGCRGPADIRSIAP
jgi:hypothetical protein